MNDRSPCCTPRQTLITLVLISESKPSRLKESWLHPTYFSHSNPAEEKTEEFEFVDNLLTKGQDKKGSNYLQLKSNLSQAKTVNSQVDAMCTPNEESICYKMNCGKALRASQQPMTRPLCPFRHVVKTQESLHFAPEIKAPLKDSEYNLKARQFWGWQQSWTHPITPRGTEEKRTNVSLKNRKAQEWKRRGVTAHGIIALNST